MAAILEAALQVLVTTGAEGLTTTRVAERAGVSVGTLYQYFPDKRALVVALRVRYVDGLVEHVGAAMRAAAGLPPEAAFRPVITALLTFKRENLQLSRAVRAAGGDFTQPEMIRAVGARLVQVTQAFVEAAAPGRAHPELVARVLVGAIEGALSVAVDESPELLASDAFAEELMRLAGGYLKG
ncbi:MAG: TetR/AcrR family transcriptional regulator [Myxococcota bacterium]